MSMLVGSVKLSQSSFSATGGQIVKTFSICYLSILYEDISMILLTPVFLKYDTSRLELFVFDPFQSYLWEKCHLEKLIRCFTLIHTEAFIST